MTVRTTHRLSQHVFGISTTLKPSFGSTEISKDVAIVSPDTATEAKQPKIGKKAAMAALITPVVALSAMFLFDSLRYQPKSQVWVFNPEPQAAGKQTKLTSQAGGTFIFKKPQTQVSVYPAPGIPLNILDQGRFQSADPTPFLLPYQCDLRFSISNAEVLEALVARRRQEDQVTDTTQRMNQVYWENIVQTLTRARIQDFFSKITREDFLKLLNTPKLPEQEMSALEQALLNTKFKDALSAIGITANQLSYRITEIESRQLNPEVAPPKANEPAAKPKKSGGFLQWLMQKSSQKTEKTKK